MNALKIAFAVAVVAAARLATPEARAQDTPTRLAGPQGGEVFFGPVAGATSAGAAMGATLRQLHDRYGARPELGRVVQAAGTGSTSVHFQVAPAHGPAVAGLVVVAPGAHGFESGVLLDDASRLRTSFPALARTLGAAWHPAPAGGAGGGATSAPAAPLRTVTLDDNSARVGLPPGWRIEPQSAQGTILAHGPQGEFAALGAAYMVIDTNTPQGRMMQMRSAGMPGTIYASALYYPSGQPLGRTFVDLTRLTSQRMHAPSVPMRVDHEQPLALRGGMRCARLQGEGGLMGSNAPARFDTVFCVAPSANGTFMALANHAAVPASVAAQQGNTVLAMRDSFQPNQAVIDEQARRIAAPAIAQIHEIGRQAALQAAEADRARIDSRHAFESYNNTRDRVAQNFTNLLRDESVVLDNTGNTHGTVWNSVADEMVKNDPNRYSIVENRDYWKGVDY
jgi:hypothetical protein